MFSAFHGTGLAEMLQADGVDRLVLAGLTTECCVASTAWDAFERDFHLFIATDACAAYEPGLHAGALEALKLSGAVLHPATEFAAVWK
jgi:ureidoacrylate peracid hydrolase